MSPMILAFGFATPWLAWAGLGAASAPIIIHLLNRRRFRRIDWAAMRFLLESQRRNRRRLRLEEIILLALRCLAVLLITLAIARPRTAASLLPAAGRAAVDHVFILDDSYSMGVMRGTSSVFSQAVEDLARLVESTPASDRVAIFLTSDPSQAWDPQREFRNQDQEEDGQGPSQGIPSGQEIPDDTKAQIRKSLVHVEDSKLLAQQIRELTITDTRANLAGAVAAARECLAESTYRRKVYLLSDFRRADYEGTAGQAIRQQLQGLLKADDAGNSGASLNDVELVLVDHGPPAAPGNLAIEGVRLLNKDAIAGADSLLGITVRNCGDKGVSNVTLNLSIRPAARPPSEALQLRATLDAIPAGQQRSVEVPCEFHEVGPNVARVELPGDPVVADNVGYLAVDVRAARAILIVDGGLDMARPSQSESFYLRYALDPEEDASSGNRVEVRSYEQISNVDFNLYDMVIFTDVPRLPEEIEEGTGRTVYPLLGALKRYVAGGGGLVLFTGERVSLNFYNGPMLASGLSPLEIRTPVGDARLREQGVSFRGGSAANLPMLRLFYQAGEDADFSSLFKFYRYHPAVERVAGELPADCGPVRVLMRFADASDSPAIVERRVGSGAVMMFYSTASASWNDWGKGVNLSYLPVMQDMVLYLARGGGGQYTDLVGRPVVQSTLPWRPDAAFAIKPPEAAKEDWTNLEVQTLEDRRIVRFDRTHWAGIYDLVVQLPGEPGSETPPANGRLTDGSGAEAAGQPGTRRQVLFARNVDVAEGDLAKADRSELTAALGVDEFTYIDRSDPQSLTAGAEPVREYWRVLLAAALAVLAMEVFLGQRFGHYAAGQQSARAAVQRT